MKRYQFGFCSWYTPVPGPYSLDFIGEMGYDGVQISDLGGETQAYPLTNKKIQDGFLSAAVRNHMQLQMINLLELGMSGRMKCDMQSVNGQIAMESLRKGIDACTELGVNTAFVPCVFGGSIDNDYDMDQVAGYLKAGCAYAEEHGVTLLLESFLGYDRTMKLHEKANGCFRLCYDSLNPYKYGFGDAVKEVEQYGTDMIHTIHIKDCMDNFQEAEEIGKGCGHFYQVAEVIDKIGYRGWIVNENNYFKGAAAKHRNPEEIIERDLITLRKAFPNK